MTETEAANQRYRDGVRQAKTDQKVFNLVWERMMPFAQTSGIRDEFVLIMRHAQTTIDEAQNPFSYI